MAQPSTRGRLWYEGRVPAEDIFRRASEPMAGAESLRCLQCKSQGEAKSGKKNHQVMTNTNEKQRPQDPGHRCRKPRNKATMAEGRAQPAALQQRPAGPRKHSKLGSRPPSPPPSQEITFNPSLARKGRRKMKSERLDSLLIETEQLQKMSIFIIA